LAVHARLLQLRRAHRTHEVIDADLRATHRAVQVTARQSVLHRTDLELTLAHVFEVLGRAEQHVDEWTDERNQAEADARPEEEGVLDAAARIFKDPVGEAEPEQHEHEEREPPRDAPRPRAEEVVDAAEGAGDGHRKILPIRYPAANANPTMAKTTRTAKTSTLTLSPAAAIVGTSLSARIDATTIQSRDGSCRDWYSSPAGLCAPSQTSSAPLQSKRPGR